MPSQETITFAPCLMCPLSHTYDLRVTISRITFVDKPEPITFTRLFTCPKTNQMFEADLTMSGYTEDVEVIGLSSEEGSQAEKGDQTNE